VFIIFECLMCVIPGPFFEEPLFLKKQKKKNKLLLSFFIASSHYNINFLSLIFELYTPHEKT
jgi:hypothetical protein